MTAHVHNYNTFRDHMREADVIMFEGEGAISWTISLFTDGPSHCGGVSVNRVIPESPIAARDLRRFVRVMESTSIDDFTGVTESRLSARIKAYKGRVWWLPLSDEVRQQMSVKRYLDFIYRQEGKKYDFRQCLFGRMPWCKENFDKFYCSELIAGALEYSGALPEINASAVTPADLARLAIYRECVQLKGKPKYIKDFNTIHPELFQK